MTASNDEERLREMLDRDEIAQTLYRYVRGIDRLDWGLARSSAHEDVKIDFGAFSVGSFAEFEVVGRAQRTVTSGPDHIATWSHLLFNMLIDFPEPGTARAETYMASISRQIRGGKAVNLLIIGRYLYRLERRSGPWKIAAYEFVTDQEMEIEDGLALPSPEGLFRGRADAQDESYRFLGLPRIGSSSSTFQ